MWLYVPPEYCPSAPALEESTSVSDSPSPAPVLFVSLSGKPAQRPLSWPEWKNRPWIKRLSGTICRPSMAARGVERWISSLQDCPASPTPSQEPKKATPTIELSGPSSCASSEKCAPPWSSSRTSQLSLPGDGFGLLERNYASWVTRSKIRSSSAREMLAHHIGGSESSSWPTARADDKRNGLVGAAGNWTTPTADDRNQRNTSYAQGGTSLSLQAGNWPTPNAFDALMEGQLRKSDRKHGQNAAERGTMHQLSLHHASTQPPPCRQAVADPHSQPGEAGTERTGRTTGAISGRRCAGTDLAAARASDGAKGGPHQVGSKSDLTLPSAAWRWGTPAARETGGATSNTEKAQTKSRLRDQASLFPSLLEEETTPDGSTSSSDGRTLNPRFQEWLMGLPPGWINSGSVEMESFRWWWQLHSECLQTLLS